MPYGQLFDSTSAADIPADAKEVAGYIDGAYVTWPQLRVRFPHAKKLSITVTGSLRAACADVETGDLTPAQGALWASRKAQLRQRPRLYCNLSTWHEVIDACSALHLPPHVVWWWIADWTGHAHAIAGASCVQYASPGYGSHGHYDVSQVFEARFVPDNRRT